MAETKPGHRFRLVEDHGRGLTFTNHFATREAAAVSARNQRSVGVRIRLFDLDDPSDALLYRRGKRLGWPPSMTEGFR